MINCPNPSCNALNAEGSEVCQTCQSALPHRYLWGVGKLLSTLRPGELYQDRYLLKRDRIFLDTRPGLVPESLPELPAFLRPYLHLSAYPVHTPKPYAVIQASSDDYVLMLESSALSTPIAGSDSKPSPPAQLPKLSAKWSEAPPLRQLSWLWQISQLWEAFIAEQVASTLLSDELVRVDGSIVRFLELTSLPVAPTNVRAQLQPTSQPTLMDLGRYWQPLADSAHQSVRAFLNRLCEQLERQQLNAEQLSEQLNQAISECAVGQVVSYDLAVRTDQGPTRKRNEDACYPQSGTHLTLSSEQTAEAPQLLIVCDGIGGHQGGDVASKLAIATIESQLAPLLKAEHPALTSAELIIAIEEAICAANDEISAQNDQAQRQARDRMGTTLVLALVKGASIYIAHLGDSRAYRIGQHNCQQVTLDDDVASRQVRLGGSLYREVLAQPGSGSLIQALGMSSSQMLRPTVQRFALDQNCVFLLCSDGLSDSDRVEQFWQQVIRPLITSENSTADAAQQLVNLANQYNGHDNVTVGLLSAQVVRASERMLPRELVSQPAKTVIGSQQTAKTQGMARGARRGTTRIVSVPAPSTDEPAKTSPSSVVTQQSSPIGSVDSKLIEGATESPATPQSSSPTQPGRRLNQVFLFLGLLAIVGSILYFLFPGLSWRLRSETEAESSERPSAESPLGNDAKPSTPQRLTALADVRAGQYLRIRQTDIPNISQTTREGADPQRLVLYPNPTIGPNDLGGAIPTGGIVRVLEQRTAAETEWAKVKLCSIPSGDSIADVPSETDRPNETDGQGETDGQRAEQPNDQALVNPAPLPDQPGQPLILSPDNEGWAIVSQLAAVAENIQDLDPTQQGQCER